MYDNAGRDCEYGNYKDMCNEYNWRDDFFPRKKARQEAQDKFREAWLDILKDIAYDNGLDTSEWDMDDFRYFADEMDLY